MYFKEKNLKDNFFYQFKSLIFNPTISIGITEFSYPDRNNNVSKFIVATKSGQVDCNLDMGKRKFSVAINRPPNHVSVSKV
jgi:hypothetical protein